MWLLQNIFVKAIIIPVVLAVAAALLELICGLAKGKSDGQRKFRVWTQKQENNGTIPISHQNLDDIRKNKNIVDIELMVNVDITNFSMVAIDLIIGAFAVDITSLINTSTVPTIIGYVLIAHLMMLIGIVLFLMLSTSVPPEAHTLRKIEALIAIGLGVLAMMIAFFVVV